MISRILPWLLAAGTACAASIDIDSYKAKDVFTLRSGEIELTIAPAHAFNINGIRFNRKTIGNSNGFYGFVVCYPKGQWVGTGHREGGAETVVSVSLKVDGEEKEIPYGGELQGQRIELTRTAKIRDDIEYHRTLTLTAADFREATTGYFLKTTRLEYWYPSMLIWPETTTHWTAELADGSREDGEFRSDNGWQLQKEIRWSSVWDPSAQAGTFVLFSASNSPAQGRKHALWDLPRYHKQYLMAAANYEFQEGYKFRYSAVVVPFASSSSDAWRTAADTLAERYKSEVLD